MVYLQNFKIQLNIRDKNSMSYSVCWLRPLNTCIVVHNVEFSVAGDGEIHCIGDVGFFCDIADHKRGVWPQLRGSFLADLILYICYYNFGTVVDEFRGGFFSDSTCCSGDQRHLAFKFSCILQNKLIFKLLYSEYSGPARKDLGPKFWSIQKILVQFWYQYWIIWFWDTKID